MYTSKKLSLLCAAVVFAPLFFAGAARAELMAPSYMSAKDYAASVESYLRTDKKLNSQGITVKADDNGNVTLSGTVSGPALRDEAIRQAERAPYAYVHSDLHVK